MLKWLTGLSLGTWIAGGLCLASLVGLIFVAADARSAHKAADKATGRAVAAEKGLATCQSTVDGLTASLERQNEAVEQLRVEADERTRRANAAIAAAQREAAVYRTKAERIAKARSGPDQCASARSLIIETLAEEREK